MCFEVLDVYSTIQYYYTHVMAIVTYLILLLPEPPQCVSCVTQVPSLIVDVEYYLWSLHTTH